MSKELLLNVESFLFKDICNFSEHIDSWLSMSWKSRRIRMGLLELMRCIIAIGFQLVIICVLLAFTPLDHSYSSHSKEISPSSLCSFITTKTWIPLMQSKLLGNSSKDVFSLVVLDESLIYYTGIVSARLWEPYILS